MGRDKIIAESALMGNRGIKPIKDAERTLYHTPQFDVGQPTPPLPEAGDSFTVYIGESGADAFKAR